MLNNPNNSFYLYWLEKFSQTFIERTSYYENMLSVISKRKDYKFYAEVFFIFIEGFKQDTIQKVDNFFESELLKITKEIEDNYLNELIQNKDIMNPITATKLQKTKFNEFINDDNILKAIKIIENQILNIKSIQKHKNNIKKDDTLDMNKEISHLLNDLKLFMEIHNQNFTPHIDNSENLNFSDENYIKIIAVSEMWNFLNHLCSAFYFRYDNKYVKSNIEKARRHIERATLDITKYKKMILDDVNTIELLKARRYEYENINKPIKSIIEFYKKIK